MTDLTASSEARTHHFMTGGNDDDTGETYNLALSSLGKALEHTLALVPPPGVGFQATIINLGGGVFIDGDLVGFDSVIGNMDGTTLQCSAGSIFGISLGSQSNMDITTVTSAVVGSTPVIISGTVTRSGFDYKFIGNFIPGGVSLDIDTIGDDIFTNGGQISAPDSGIGFRDLSPDTVVHISNHNLIDMIGNDAIGAVLGGANSVKEINFNSIIFRNGFTGTKGIVGAGLGNETVIARGGRIVAATAIEVPDGGDWTVNAACIVGNIDVLAGGILYADITKHLSGVVNNLGLINGQINGVLYGGYRQDTEFLVTFNATSNISTSWDDQGQFSIDTTTDSIDSIVASYTQTNSGSRQVDYQIVDAATPSTVYYQGLNSASGADRKQVEISLTPITPLPTDQLVNMLVQFKRTGGSGLNSPGSNIYFTRTP